jgi:hypothetical protein
MRCLSHNGSLRSARDWDVVTASEPNMMILGTIWGKTLDVIPKEQCDCNRIHASEAEARGVDGGGFRVTRIPGYPKI